MQTIDSIPIQVTSKDDLDSLCLNRVEESLYLDYKDSRALARSEHSKAEVSKDVSAFANSAGGTIVYGIQEVRPKRGAPYAGQVDTGSDCSQITGEWIESVLLSRIRPRVEGVSISSIPLSGEESPRFA